MLHDGPGLETCLVPRFFGRIYYVRHYQSKTICEHKNVSYEAHLCPIIVKVEIAPNAQATLQIVDRHYEELKSSRPDSQTLKKAQVCDWTSALRARCTFTWELGTKRLSDLGAK